MSHSRKTAWLMFATTAYLALRVYSLEESRAPAAEVAAFREMEIQSGTGGKFDVVTFARAHRVTIVSFWASWCGPCRRELPALQELARIRKGLGVLAVNVGESQDQIDAFVKQEAIELPIAHTDGAAISSLPYLLVLDPQGEVLAIERGYRPGLEERLTRWMDE